MTQEAESPATEATVAGQQKQTESCMDTLPLSTSYTQKIF